MGVGAPCELSKWKRTPFPAPGSSTRRSSRASATSSCSPRPLSTGSSTGSIVRRISARRSISPNIAAICRATTSAGSTGSCTRGTDRYYLKEYEADTNANFSVILDVSRSMSFGSRGITKLDYGKFLCACLVYFAQKQRDRIGCVTFDNDIVAHIPPSAKHLDRVLHTLDKSTPNRKGDLTVPMQKMAEHFGRRGILVIVSDLYENPETVLEAVKPLRYRGNDLIVFHVLDPAEIDFNFSEAASFQDLETGEQIPVVPTALAAQYRTLVQEHVAALSSRFAANRVDYSLTNTATPLDYALFKYLSARQRLSRVR